MRSPFQVKICGLTRPEDATVSGRAGADAVGLNFYPASPRYVTPDQARTIADSLPAGVAKVGVFVNAELETMRAAGQRVSLDAVQLSGDEPTSVVRGLAPMPVIRALRFPAPDDSGLRRIQAEAEAGLLAAVLVDAFRRDEYGGTGQTIDWSRFQSLRELFPQLPLILAGGLTPDNVVAAITTALPDGVDVASGVESAPGVKDRPLVECFVRQARVALATALDRTDL